MPFLRVCWKMCEEYESYNGVLEVRSVLGGEEGGVVIA